MKKQKNRKIKCSVVVSPKKETLEIKKLELELIGIRLKLLLMMIGIPPAVTAMIVALDKFINS